MSDGGDGGNRFSMKGGVLVFREEFGTLNLFPPLRKRHVESVQDSCSVSVRLHRT